MEDVKISEQLDPGRASFSADSPDFYLSVNLNLRDLQTFDCRARVSFQSNPARCESAPDFHSGIVRSMQMAEELLTVERDRIDATILALKKRREQIMEEGK